MEMRVIAANSINNSHIRRSTIVCECPSLKSQAEGQPNSGTRKSFSDRAMRQHWLFQALEFGRYPSLEISLIWLETQLENVKMV